jgi:pimeloyl-ACP methyl ester carboxylesterase
MKPISIILLTILFILLVLILVVPLVIPIPPIKDTSSPEDLADPDSQFITINDVKIHYKIKGQGKPVFILLHGFGSNLHSWDQVMDDLSKDGTVIAFDRPAFGLTERPTSWEGENPYTPEAQVDQTIGLMDALGIDNAILIGNSAGGTIATRTALEYPERVEALILVDAAIYQQGGASGWLQKLMQTPQLRRLGPLLVRSIQSRGEDLIQLAWHNPGLITPSTLENYRKPLKADNWDRALWEFTQVNPGPDLSTQISAVDKPVLVITGDDDQIVPTEQSVRLADEIPGAKLSILPACGHVPQEECPKPFLESVFAFLDEIRNQSD